MGRPSIGFHPPAVPRETVEEPFGLLVSTHVPSAGGGVRVEIGLSTYAAALQRNGLPGCLCSSSVVFLSCVGLRAGSINVHGLFCRTGGFRTIEQVR
jgi:hypothetical protein